MKKIDFNSGWTVKTVDVPGEERAVTLPHDAMLTEKRHRDNPGAHNIGYFEGHDYEYKKVFTVPKDLTGQELTLEFEGVYHNAEVSVNGAHVLTRPYGYTNFYVPLSDFLKDGENEITVLAKNADQPNSRWYTGSGIYRPVWLYAAEKEHILMNGIRVRTVSAAPKSYRSRRGDAVLALSVLTSTPGELSWEIFDTETKGDAASPIAQGIAESGKEVEISLQNVQLWSGGNPHRYRLKVRFFEDCEELLFGIRSLEWSREKGLLVNGRRIILKGACIHADNGLLGAITDPDAEARRVKLLKKNGYNAIRCAHNPCSKYLLEACDKYGMYLMDEYVDMWYIHKTRYDYAAYMTDWYERDLKDMVEKDYNHPSVLLYSTGNEVAETGEPRGIELTKKMTDFIHALDSTRPVTCGVNIFFNYLYSLGFGVYSDEKAEETQKKQTVGSEFYNTLAGIFGDTTMKLGAALHGSDVKTRDTFSHMDVAGYNYGILRYAHDLRKYPNRLILGTETFCRDAFQFYEMAKRQPGILGDFVWAGMDYLGETGIGAWEYEDYAAKDADPAGWLAAGSGRLDITGMPNGEAYYTRVALGKTAGPYLAVSPVYQTGAHSPSAWKMTDAIRSWSYAGCEGLDAKVEVYARAHEVELFLNGRSLGRKGQGNPLFLSSRSVAEEKNERDCVFRFRVKYESGLLEAVAYDKHGTEIGRDHLKTAGEETRLAVSFEEETVGAGRLSYVQLAFTDENGTVKPMERHRITLSVENGTLLGFGSACPYQPDAYQSATCDTYYGRALAVIRAGEKGELKLTAVWDENEVTALQEVR